MADKALIVVHGMGTHTEASVRQGVTAAFDDALSLYDSLRGSSTGDHFDVVSVAYNDFFEGFRQNAAASGDSLLEHLAAVRGEFPLIPDLASRLASLDSELTSDAFFKSHWLDVLLYRFSLLAEPIRLRVATAVAREVRDRGAANVHVLGHSLGTSVVHDALAKLYGSEPLIDGNDDSLKLQVNRDRLVGVHQVANVSRLLQSFRKVGASEVRPGVGCCATFVEYRHKLDPIAKIKPFDPTDNQEWVPHAVYRHAYDLIEPSGVVSANVHDLGHYLRDPLVHLELFASLFRFRPRVAEREAALEAHLANTVQGRAAALRNVIENLDLSRESVEELLRAAMALKDMVLAFGEEFR